MVKSWSDLREGDVMNGWLNRRLKANQNGLVCITGKTGSGKSYASLRIAELWYQYHFHRPFPVENIVFTPQELLKRLVFGKLERGELIVYEEGGVSMGNLDWQNKISKAFNYVLQSFRSMNVAIIMNLPYFSMLNKQTRMLMHMLMTTEGIDHHKKQCTLKPFILQIAQDTGKCYKHFPQISVAGNYEKIHFFNYSLPTDELRAHYEERKAAFVQNTAQEALETSTKKCKYDDLTDLQKRIVECWKEGILIHQSISDKLGKVRSQISSNICFLRRKGYTPDQYAPDSIAPKRHDTARATKSTISPPEKQEAEEREEETQ